MDFIKLPTPEPHGNVLTLVRGAVHARSALILLHGRGGSSHNIMEFAERLRLRPDVLIIAPQASGNQWYPQRFMVTQEENEPHLTSALAVVAASLAHCAGLGIPHEHVVIAGFSQGACLSAEYAARNPRRYGGVCVMSGGLIGSDEEIHARTWEGDFAGTPVYIGCDARDTHIPLERVQATSAIFTNLQARVQEKVYEDLGHSIHPDALSFLHEILGETAEGGV